jgi:hypothetical protein
MAGVVPAPMTTPGTLYNNSAWYNLTAWTVNVTRYAPSLEDLVWAGPRMVKKLGSFITLAEPLHPSAENLAFGSPAVAASADPALVRTFTTESNIYNMMEPAIAVGGGHDEPVAQASRLTMEGARGLGSVFSYATSKWALSCVAMSIVLNRTHIFAATRRRLRLRWHLRLLLRILPIVLLIVQIRSILQSIQCQTSADFAELRWGNSSKSSDLLFSHSNTVLNTMSSTLLLGASDEQSCLAIQMIPPSEGEHNPRSLRGSLSLLWPLFGTFCLSHFLETISNSVQGRPLTSETGMTLFEQSLAFAEADSAISNQLGWGIFSKSGAEASSSTSSGGSTIALTRSMILKRVNTPPEVLLIAFLSSMTHLTSQTLGLFNLQAKYRLYSTGFWGFCYMASIVWSAATFDLDDPNSQGLLRFPTVAIIGFVPHVLVVIGIILCSSIYGLALVLSALAPPTNQRPGLTFRQRLADARQNMQANVSLGELRITREMDLYTALLRTGFAAITMASEAVYLNEDRGVGLKRHTWLEEARYKEAEELQQQYISLGLPNSSYDQIGAIGLIPVKANAVGASGYSRERAAQKVTKSHGERAVRVGIGATERSSRWLMAFDFLLAVNRLLTRLIGLSGLWCLRFARIKYQPRWLLWMARRTKKGEEDVKSKKRDRKGLNRNATSAYNEDGRIPRTDGIDVEAEFRRTGTLENEEELDQDLYKYWLKGGWWGSKDSSGDYLPHPDEDDWDATSVISMATTNATNDEDGWESEDSGQRTPTQRTPQRSREATPLFDSPMAMGDLARLLHPTSPEERDDARVLSAHLGSDTIMTRSGFQRLQKLQRTRILTSQVAVTSPNQNVKLTPEEEERTLEQLLLSRRRRQSNANNNNGTTAATSWEEGADGLGSDGPQCVVCQCTPRTIIVWPCRCLSLCDDCRVSLAMNNFDKCVCCRREVISFSRIFVP